MSWGRGHGDLGPGSGCPGTGLTQAPPHAHSQPGPQHSSQGPASGTCTHQALLPPWGRQQHRRHPASDRLFPDLGTGRGGGGRGQGRGARPPPPGAVLASSGAQGWPTQRALPGSLLPPALRLEVALGAWGQAALTNGPQRVPGTLEGLPGGCPAPAPSWPGDALQVCPLCGWLQAQPGLRAAAPPGGWGAASVTTAGTGPLTALGPRNDPRALLGMPVPPSGARAPGKRSWPGVPTEDMWQSQRKDGALTPGVGGLGRTRDWRCPHRSPGPSPTPPHPRSQGAVTPGLDAPHHGSQPPERPTGDSRGPTRPASPLRGQDRPTGSCPHVRLWAQTVRGGAQPGDRAQLPRVTPPRGLLNCPRAATAWGSGAPRWPSCADARAPGPPDRSQGLGPWLHPPEPPAPPEGTSHTAAGGGAGGARSQAAVPGEALTPGRHRTGPGPGGAHRGSGGHTGQHSPGLRPGRAVEGRSPGAGPSWRGAHRAPGHPPRPTCASCPGREPRAQSWAPSSSCWGGPWSLSAPPGPLHGEPIGK